jgi:hypothetical protein
MRRRSGPVLALAVALLLTACGGDGANDTGASGASASSGTSGPTGTTGSVPATDLEDGRHFGYVRALHPDGEMRFDLADFLTGDEATHAAEEHGDEAPPPNDYYIVNDNPRLRTLALAPDADIEVFDWNRCCDDTVSIDVADLRRAIASGPDGVEVDGALVHGNGPWWLTLEGGVVTKIEEQFLP